MVRNYKETTTFQIESDLSASHSFQESSSPRMAKSPSLQRVSGGHGFRASDVAFNSLESPKVRSPPSEQLLENGASLDGADKEPSITRQDSFETRLPELPKIEVQTVHRQTSDASDPESPVSPLLTSDPKNERSHSQTFSRPNSEFGDMQVKLKDQKGRRSRKPPSFWRLVELSLAEWLYAVLGSTGAAIFGSFNPLLAYIIALIVTAYYKFDEIHPLRHEVNKWCLVIAGMGIVTVVANFLQHFYFGIMGEKMTERVRRMMFSGDFPYVPWVFLKAEVLDVLASNIMIM
ncbi:ATP-binding cassette sub- B member 6, mitochondrial [Ancistrocladus abbreviatus]